MIFKDKIYVAEKDNKIIAASDDETIINTYSADNIRTINGTPAQNLTDIDDFALIENTDDKEYGYSTIWQHDDKYSITMYQNRLIVDKSTFDTAVAKLEDTGKAYSDDSDSLHGIINCHLDFWMRSNEDIETGTTCVYAFTLSDAEITALLRTGFTATNLLLIV